MEKIREIEQKVNLVIDLLEIAKSYCEFNYDKSRELSALDSILEIIIKNQQDASQAIDGLYIG